jgi:hypothetical protein
MDKIRHPTAPNGVFTEGDPLRGIIPTVITAAHLNAVQNEIVNVIVQAGLIPSATDETQLATAIIQFVEQLAERTMAAKLTGLVAADILGDDNASPAWLPVETIVADAAGGILVSPILGD